MELQGVLHRHRVSSQSRCGRIESRECRRLVMARCCAEPCKLEGNGFCEAGSRCTSEPYCRVGDFIDCDMVVPVVSGMLPDAIGRLGCLAGQTSHSCTPVRPRRAPLRSRRPRAVARMVLCTARVLSVAANWVPLRAFACSIPPLCASPPAGVRFCRAPQGLLTGGPGGHRALKHLRAE